MRWMWMMTQVNTEFLRIGANDIENIVGVSITRMTPELGPHDVMFGFGLSLQASLVKGDETAHPWSSVAVVIHTILLQTTDSFVYVLCYEHAIIGVDFLSFCAGLREFTRKRVSHDFPLPRTVGRHQTFSLRLLPQLYVKPHTHQITEFIFRVSARQNKTPLLSQLFGSFKVSLQVDGNIRKENNFQKLSSQSDCGLFRHQPGS